MIPILAPIAAIDKKKVQYLIDNYKRLGIYIRPIKYEDSTLYVQIEQKKFINDKILTASELIDRGKEVFKDKFFVDTKVIVSPIFDNTDELRGVNADYVKAKMRDLKLKPSHIYKALGLDKSTVSLLLSGERQFTNSMRAAFYYFFKYKNIRDVVNN